MVVAAEQRAGQVGAGVVQSPDLLVENLESSGGNGLPFGDVGGIKNAVDVIQAEARVLEHADEDEAAEGRVAIAALS